MKKKLVYLLRILNMFSALLIHATSLFDRYSHRSDAVWSYEMDGTTRTFKRVARYFQFQIVLVTFYLSLTWCKTLFTWCKKTVLARRNSRPINPNEVNEERLSLKLVRQHDFGLLKVYVHVHSLIDLGGWLNAQRKKNSHTHMYMLLNTFPPTPSPHCTAFQLESGNHWYTRR